MFIKIIIILITIWFSYGFAERFLNHKSKPTLKIVILIIVSLLFYYFSSGLSFKWFLGSFVFFLFVFYEKKINSKVLMYYEYIKSGKLGIKYEEDSFLDYFIYLVKNIDGSYFTKKKLLYYFDDVIYFYIKTIQNQNEILNNNRVANSIKSKINDDRFGMQYMLWLLMTKSSSDLSMDYFLFDSLERLNTNFPKSHYLINYNKKLLKYEYKNDSYFQFILNMSKRIESIVINKRPKKVFLSLWKEMEIDLEKNNYFKN